ncbi:hypothetical protein Tco_1310329 [Tanacetum coccineum]
MKDPSATTILPISETLSTIQLRASELEKEVKELKKVDHSTTIHVSIRSQVPAAVNEYLGTSLGDTLQKVLQKHTEELRHEFSQKDVSKNPMFDQKEILFHMIKENKSYEKHPTHQALYDALMQSMILDKDGMEKAKTFETPTQKNRQHGDRDQDPPTGSDKGFKKRKTSKDAEPSKKPKSTGLSKRDDTGNTDEQPDVEVVTKNDWFRKPARPPTPDPEWNKHKSVDDGPEQSWLNDVANTGKKTSNVQKLCELEYNMEECYRDLSDQLDRNNPKGNHFFFNNDLEYLRGGSTGRKYTASITKTKAAKISWKKALNLLNALDYRIQQLSKGSNEGSDVSNDEENKAGENKADAEVAKKQAGNHQHPDHQPHKLKFKCVRPLDGKTVQEKLGMLCWCKGT